MTRLSRCSQHDGVLCIAEIRDPPEVTPQFINEQNCFDDDKYLWKCTECGHKNSISRDNIFESQEDFFGGEDPMKY